MNFDDHDWEGDDALPGPTTDASTGLKVAAGVLAGIVIGAAAVYTWDRHPPQSARPEAAQVHGEATRKGAGTPEPAARQAVREGVAREAEAAAPEILLREAPPGFGAVAASASASSAAAVGVARRAEPRQSAAQSGPERKAQAWAQHYKAPRHCAESPSADTLVDCANHYIRAKREFDAGYMADAP